MMPLKWILALQYKLQTTKYLNIILLNLRLATKLKFLIYTVNLRNFSFFIIYNVVLEVPHDITNKYKNLKSFIKVEHLC